MEEKEVGTIREVTKGLIIGFIIYGLLASLLFDAIYTYITKIIDLNSFVLIGIVQLLFSGIIVFCAWGFSISSTFSKKAINKTDVPIVIKNMIIFTLMVVIISALLNYLSTEQRFDKSVKSDLQTLITEEYKDSDNELLKNYLEEQEKTISDAKRTAQTYYLCIDVGKMVVYTIIVLLFKKSIMKYAI